MKRQKERGRKGVGNCLASPLAPSAAVEAQTLRNDKFLAHARGKGESPSESCWSSPIARKSHSLRCLLYPLCPLPLIHTYSQGAFLGMERKCIFHFLPYRRYGSAAAAAAADPGRTRCNEFLAGVQYSPIYDLACVISRKVHFLLLFDPILKSVKRKFTGREMHRSSSNPRPSFFLLFLFLPRLRLILLASK